MAKAKGENYNEKEIRIVGVDAELATDIKNIAANLGVNMSDFLKPFLLQARDSYSKLITKNKDRRYVSK